jgi:hypothetical protein
MTNELLIHINQSGIVRIETDGKKIAIIQSFKLEVDSNKPLPYLEVVFPNIPKESNSPVKEKVQEYIELMQKLPYCKVVLEGINES